ncbi:MAG: hypothetical protein KAS87_00515 [Candidatus Omnitrophica bacterium]|nr:hypothetical protein [Candidatus Omnitrophota bacterium]
MDRKLAQIYFGILGVVSLVFGVVNILTTISGKSLLLGILEIPADMFRGGWGGLVILSAGLFYLSGAKRLSEIHHFSKVVMASILLWLIAACDIFAMVCESIPGGEEGPFFNTLHGFFAAYAPPYKPAIFLLPFSLVVIYYIYKRRSE